jgi:hypothetical protein
MDALAVVLVSVSVTAKLDTEKILYVRIDKLIAEGLAAEVKLALTEAKARGYKGYRIAEAAITRALLKEALGARLSARALANVETRTVKRGR